MRNVATECEIIDKNSIQNKQCAYMYIGAGRDVWSGLGVTVLVCNGVGQSLYVNSTFWCINWSWQGSGVLA